MELATGQQVQGSNPNSDMGVCNKSDSTLNGCLSLFSLRVQMMAVAKTTQLNQPQTFNSMFTSILILNKCFETIKAPHYSECLWYGCCINAPFFQI